MRYLAAFFLLIIAGVENPDAAAIIKILNAADVSVDEDRVSALLSELEGKDINSLIAEGNSKLSSVPSGGAAAGGGGGSAAAAASGGAAAAAEEKKEEKAEEKEESDDDMGFGLFD